MLLAVLLCIVAYGVGDSTQKGTLIQSPRSEQDNSFQFEPEGVDEKIIWALTQENLSSRVCEQQRRRPACAD